MDEKKNPQKKDALSLEDSEKHNTKKVSESEIKNTRIDNKKIDKHMEVHVKPHNDQKHSLKVFLYEFFIIFLAVSLSFIVENIREEYIDHHKEVQYVKSLVNDIKLDTTQLSSIIKYNQKQFKGIDTLLRIMENPNNKDIVKNIYIYSFEYLNSLNVFAHTDRTITQLKNAGGLRLIQSKAASDSIVTYDALVQDIEQNGDICLKCFYDISKQQKELLYYKVSRSKELQYLLANSKLELLDSNPKKIDYYFNETLYFGFMIEGYTKKLIKLKIHATQLLETLKVEYDLE